MDKRILLGSIIAVVILVMVSFTGVVGYQTTKSSTIARVSPLFSIRCNRAIDEESKDLTCNYVGKGEETNLHLSSRIKRAEQVQKFIDIIGKMDDRTFSRFVARIIFYLRYQEQQMTGKETSDVLQALYYIRKNPNDMKYYDTENNPISDTSEYWSCFWFPGCNILSILTEIWFWISLTIIAIITHLQSCVPVCNTIACPS